MNILRKGLLPYKRDATNLDKWYSDTIHDTAREIEKWWE